MRRGSRNKLELSDIGDGFGGGSGVFGPFVIGPTRERGETLGFEHLPHGRRAQGLTLFLELVADLVDGVVLLAQLDNTIPGRRLLGLGSGTMPG